MGARLDQVLAYLERDGVTEVVLGIGRPLSVRRGGQLVPLTNAPVTRGQLNALVEGTALAALIPEADGTSDPVDVAIGARRVRVQAGRRGDEILLRIEKAPIEKAPAPRAKTPTAGPRAKTPTGAPRAKTPTGAPRAKTPTGAQRAKTPTGAQRAKTPTGAQRAKSATRQPVISATRSIEIDLETSRPGAAIPPPAGLDLGFDVDMSTARPGQPITLPTVRPAPPPPPASPGVGGLDLGIDLGGPSPRPGTSPGAAARSSEMPPSASRRAELPPRPPTARPAPASLDLGDLELDLTGPASPPARAASPAPAAVTFDEPVHVAAAPVPARVAPTATAGFPRELAEVVRRAHERRATDLHIASGRVTAVRVLGDLVPLDAGAGPASAAQVDALLGPLLAPHRARFDSVGYIDLAIEAPTGGRLRTNISRAQGGIKATFRLARAEPPTLEDLGLPRDLTKAIGHHQGLVVIAGPSGHGKTTTLSALVDLINAAKPYHIITVEDPIEIVYPRKAAVVSQREVGPHTKSFAAALKGSLREDPDVIVIGELRDRETVEIALTAAETGHLVLATMSTPSAAKTIDRLVDMFPPDDQTQVRASIAGALRAIVAQRLLPSATGGMVAAVELLTGCLPLASLIRDDKLFQLPNLMQRGRAFGMIRLDDSLIELVRGGKITADTAIAISDNKKELTATLKGGAPAGAAPAPARAPEQRGGLGGLFGKKGRE